MTTASDQQIDSYHLGHCRHQDALGECYQATAGQESLPDWLRLLPASLCVTPTFPARWHSLLGKLRTLQHPALQPFRADGSWDDRTYLVWAVQDDQPLTTPPRDFSVALTLGQQAAAGLAALHQAGLVDGALQPQRLLLGWSTAGTPQLRLSEPGLWSLLGGTAANTSPSPYTAPECATGVAPTPRSDIYALGAILAWLCTGAPPDQGTNLATWLQAQALPATVQALLAHCLAPEPAARYATATALAIDLATIADELTAQPAAQTVGIPPTLHLRLVEPATLFFTPAETQTVQITASNAGNQRTTAYLYLEGLPVEWVAISPTSLTLDPGEQATATLTISIPRDQQNAAGEYPVILRLQPTDLQQRSARLAMLWTLRSFADDQLTLQPTSAAGQTTAHYTVTLTHQGNAPIRRVFALQVAAPLRGTITPTTLDLDPNATGQVQVEINAPPRAIGFTQRRPFTIEAQSANAPPLRATGQFQQQPRLNLWSPIIAVCLLLLAGVGITYGRQPRSSQAPTPTVIAVAGASNEPSLAPTSEPATVATTAAPPTTAPPTATVRPSALTLSSTALRFDTIPIGANAVQTVQVQNTGKTALAFQRIQITGPQGRDYSHAGPCGLNPLDANVGCPLTIIFSPTGSGPRIATVVLTLTNGTTATIELQGSASATLVGTPQAVAAQRTIPPLAGMRTNHTTSPLANGQRLLIAGGYNGPNVIKSTEIYDQVTNTWSGGRDLLEGRARHSATTLPNGMVVVIGGRSATQVLKSAEVYDSTTRTWTAFPALNTAREGHTSTLLVDAQTRGYRILVIGGRDQNGNILESGEIYDSNTQSWTRIPRLLADGRVDHTATVLKPENERATPRLLLVGGTNRNGHAPAMLLEPLSVTAPKEITDEPVELQQRSGYSATLVEATGQIVFIGGTTADEPTAAVTFYNPAATGPAAWATGQPLAAPRTGHTAALLPYGQILLLAGITETHATTSTELYDPAHQESP